MQALIPVLDRDTYSPLRHGDYITIEGHCTWQDTLFVELQKIFNLSFNTQCIIRRSTDQTTLHLVDRVQVASEMTGIKKAALFTIVLSTVTLTTIGFYELFTAHDIKITLTSIAILLTLVGSHITYATIGQQYHKVRLQSGLNWLKNIAPHFFLPMPKHLCSIPVEHQRSPGFWEAWPPEIRPNICHLKEVFPPPRALDNLTDLLHQQMYRIHLFQALVKDPSSSKYFEKKKGGLLNQLHRDCTLLNSNLTIDGKTYIIAMRNLWELTEETPQFTYEGTQIAFFPPVYTYITAAFFDSYLRKATRDSTPFLPTKLFPRGAFIHARPFTLWEIPRLKKERSTRHLKCQLRFGNPQTDQALYQVAQELFDNTRAATKCSVQVLNPTEEWLEQQEMRIIGASLQEDYPAAPARLESNEPSMAWDEEVPHNIEEVPRNILEIFRSPPRRAVTDPEQRSPKRLLPLNCFMPAYPPIDSLGVLFALLKCQEKGALEMPLHLLCNIIDFFPFQRQKA